HTASPPVSTPARKLLSMLLLLPLGCKLRGLTLARFAGEPPTRGAARSATEAGPPPTGGAAYGRDAGLGANAGPARRACRTRARRTTSNSRTPRTAASQAPW